MKKIITTIVLALCLILFLIVFIDVAEPQKKENGKDFVYSIPEVSYNLKSVGSLDKRMQDVVNATSRGLVELNYNNEIIPSLSESVEVKDDGLEYDFKLRDDIYWSDGTKIIPSDIATFFREILTEEDEENISALLNVYGAKAYRGGSGSFSKDVGISYGENNIVFRLNSKDDKFIEELTMPQYRIRKNVLLWEDINNNYNSLIYSGNYTIDNMSLSEIDLKKNDYIDLNIVRNIKVIIDEGEEVAMAAFEIGERDIVINPPKSQLNRLNNEGRLINLKANKAMYLAFNPKDNRLQLEGRKEIYKLFNKAFESYQLDNSLYIELAEGSYFRADKEDLSKLQARKVMSVGETDWEKPKIIHLIAEESSENKEISEYLVKWFENNTNIQLIYDLVKLTELEKINQENYYDMALISGNLSLTDEGAIYNDLVKFLDVEKREKFISLKTEGERMENFLSIEEELFNQYKILPLMFYNDNIAVNKKFKNMSLDGNGNIDFSKIEKGTIAQWKSKNE